MPELAERYAAVNDCIAAAAAAAGRNTDDITLVVVTKNHDAKLVLDLLDCGARDFGENRDQEAAPRGAVVAEALAAQGQGIDYRWHFVGQLQSNKVRSVLRYASAIHSLDRVSLLDALAKESAKLAAENDFQAPGVFIELNLTDDPGRGGLPPVRLEEFAASVLEVPTLKLLGVMGVASLDGVPERDFEIIRGCSERLQKLAPEAKYISAGMSGDFELAIAYGATHLRVGTAITGQRQY